MQKSIQQAADNRIATKTYAEWQQLLDAHLDDQVQHEDAEMLQCLEDLAQPSPPACGSDNPEQLANGAAASGAFVEVAKPSTREIHQRLKEPKASMPLMWLVADLVKQLDRHSPFAAAAWSDDVMSVLLQSLCVTAPCCGLDGPISSGKSGKFGYPTQQAARTVATMMLELQGMGDSGSSRTQSLLSSYLQGHKGALHQACIVIQALEHTPSRARLTGVVAPLLVALTDMPEAPQPAAARKLHEEQGRRRVKVCEELALLYGSDQKGLKKCLCQHELQNYFCTLPADLNTVRQLQRVFRNERIASEQEAAHAQRRQATKTRQATKGSCASSHQPEKQTPQHAARPAPASKASGVVTAGQVKPDSPGSCQKPEDWASSGADTCSPSPCTDAPAQDSHWKRESWTFIDKDPPLVNGVPCSSLWKEAAAAAAAGQPSTSWLHAVASMQSNSSVAVSSVAVLI